MVKKWNPKDDIVILRGHFSVWKTYGYGEERTVRIDKEYKKGDDRQIGSKGILIFIREKESKS